LARRLAAIDVGTNSVLLVVADVGQTGAEPHALLERARITRLGRGVDRSGVLSAEGIAATLEALSDFAAEASALGVSANEIACVATSAARDAKNGSSFLEQAERKTGLHIRIIDGEHEANLSYLAAHREFGAAERDLLIQDIGGGSTEFVRGSSEQPVFARSIPIGSVRLFERWIRHDPPTREEREPLEAEIAAAVRDLPGAADAVLIGLAGTWTTLAAIATGSPTYEAALVHGKVLSKAEIDSLTETLWHTPLELRRQLPGLQPGRADVIPVGASIARMSMELLGLSSVTVSDRGVRWGLLYERLADQS
jgi:exopolyphosphatase/guanosine-5'-triphosphate,3'-diphosphate pyrophosphatase